MSIPITEPRASRTPLVVVLTLIVVAVLVAVMSVVFAPSETTEKAQAHALTSVTNSGIPGALSQGITAVRDNGTYTYPQPGYGAVWGIKAIRVEHGTCVSINGGTPKCATAGAFNVALGIGSYYVRRTK